MDSSLIATPSYLFVCGSSDLARTLFPTDVCVPTLLKTEDQNLRTDFVSVSAFKNRTSVIDKGNKAYVWGFNEESAVYTSKLALIEPNLPYKQVCFSFFEKYMLTTDGDIYIGKNKLEGVKAKYIASNSLGYAFIDNELNVVVSDFLKIENLKELVPKSLHMTDEYIAILCENNELRIISTKDGSEQPPIPDIVSCAASQDKFVIINTKSQVFELLCNGQYREIFGFKGTPIKAFAGFKHYGVITYQGECFTWGWGLSGQLGNGIFMNSNKPVKVKMNDSLRIVDADAGSEHTVFLAVKEISYTPAFPSAMLQNDYIKTVRMESISQAAMNPDNMDIKFELIKQ